MKHTAVITFERATCQCGQMRGLWRQAGETIGDFTKRSYAAYEQHRDTAEAPADLFDYRRHTERPESRQAGLFA